MATLNARAASNTSRRAGFAHFARWPDGPGRVEGAVPAEIDRQACAECARNPPALWSLRRGDSARQSGSGHATAGCSLHESGRMRGHTVADGASAAPVTSGPCLIMVRSDQTRAHDTGRRSKVAPMGLFRRGPDRNDPKAGAGRADRPRAGTARLIAEPFRSPGSGARGAERATIKRQPVLFENASAQALFNQDNFYGWRVNPR